MNKINLALFFLIFSFWGNSQTVNAVVGTTPFQDSLWVFSSSSYQVTHAVAPTLAGSTITGLNGLAKHPISGTNYAICKVSGVTGRILGKINPVTGIITNVGNLGDNFSSITFASDTLFGVTGDGANVPETLFRIDTTNAATTFYRTLGNGADGEVICYNPADGMIYHWSGNGTALFEKFLASSPTSPIIPISPSTGSGEIFGAKYLSSSSFLISTISSEFKIIDIGGTVGPALNSNPDNIRGMIPFACNRLISGNPDYCINDSTELVASSSLSYQWIKNGIAISGATSQNYYASTNGSYSCIVQDLCGTDTITTSIAVSQGTTPSVALTASNTSICQGDSVLISGSSGGTSQWHWNGAPIPGATSNTYYATMSGTYNMTKTNTSGCSDSASSGIQISVFALPALTFNITIDTVCQVDPAFNLSATPSGGTFSGIGVSGNTFTPSSVSNPGSVNVSYTYTDGNGCSNTAIDSVMVMICFGLEELNQGEISLYPVPASDKLHLEFVNPKSGELKLFDMNGKKLAVYKIDMAKDFEIDVQSLENGIYLIQIANESIKFVVKH